TWKAPHPVGYQGEIARVVDSVALYDLLALATSELATTQVRAVAWLRARQLKGWLDASSASASDPAEKAHLAYAAAQIEQFQKDPKRLDMPPPSEPPDGPPIGDEEEFSPLP